MKRLLIITDSLGLPRSFPEQCPYEQTWPILLKESGNYLMHQVSIGGATIDELYEQLNSYQLAFNPDLIIVQSGIVDCAPRALGKKELLLLSSNLLTRKLTSVIVKKYSYSMRKRRNISYTPLKKFEQFLRRFQQLETKGTPVFWLGILPGSAAYERKVPGISKRINGYNMRIQEVFGDRYLDTSTIPSSGVMSDYFHLNAEGHDFIVNLVRKQLQMPELK